ncbi:MAG: helix-turn-helix domain-containing protein [Hespellia sp.]|nr:helix-turn-helix domain-containing protein [Hespellia sp.]
MTESKELERAISELAHTTGLHITITTNSDEETENAVSQLRQLNYAYKEKFNKTYFLRQVLLGYVDTSNLSERCHKLHLSTDTDFALILLETKAAYEEYVPEILRQLFPSISRNHVIAMDPHTICILAANLADDQIQQTAHTVADTLNAEAMTPVHMTYAMKRLALADLPKQYKESALTLQIGRIFYPEKSILPSNQLGIGRLISQLPVALCEDFLSEIFNNQLPSQFDEEITATINTFFQTNLNIAETSRQLHIHRNTLIYRLEQLLKSTGLDIRKFEDAMTFKIATMVINYIHTKKEL